ncbi:MAG: glutamate decarboxylase [Peptococcaceae bacterium]|nr:glutamate decarboxylase [Peptococcaceae bacterium]
MWTVIYIAANKNIAEKYQKALAAEGILTKLRPIGSSPHSNSVATEILVLESEAEEAHEILTDIIGS